MTAIAALTLFAMLPPFEAMTVDYVPLSVSAYTDASGVLPWGITASGVKTRDGICACGPSYPFGSLFILPDGRVLECQDRGGAITDGHLDMWCDDEAWALDVWERRKLWVWVIQ